MGKTNTMYQSYGSIMHSRILQESLQNCGLKEWYG